MVLYHGSEYVIEYPQPWLGRKCNDYGQGFYCTESEKMAGALNTSAEVNKINATKWLQIATLPATKW